MNLLVTGGAGFIGSNFIEYISQKYNYKIIVLDKLTYAGNFSNLKGINYHKFIKGDICNYTLIKKICKDEKIELIVNFAAETHVDNSIKNPNNFVESNIYGTFTLLEIVKKLNIKFLHISTDEVYGSIKSGKADEKYPYKPNSPYSASKASSDLLVRSYIKTYNIQAITTNCSNNFGKKQHQEKLIPTIINNALSKKAIPIYGDGENIRDWIHVKDHCRALDVIIHSANWQKKYNIGADNLKTNTEITNIICDILNDLVPSHINYKNLIIFTQDRPGHDYRYAISSNKLKQLGWTIEDSFKEQITETIKWYIQRKND